MNKLGQLALGILLLLGVAAAGYWFGTRAVSATKATASADNPARKVLYYRNPMGLPDTSPVPKKDAMGMDYVPVYAGDETDAALSGFSSDKIQKLGVKSEAAALRGLNRILRVTGRIEIDERRIYTIAPKFEGWVERLYVNTTGQSVAKGQALFDVYSPDLISAQREHALAVQGLAALKDADDEVRQSMQRLAEAGATRLRNWNIADMSAASGDARPRVTFHAPVSGTVLEKKAVQGMRFMPGEMLYQIADLSSVWVVAEIPEQDIAQVQAGSRARISVDAWPARTFDGRVDFIYPALNSATRTVQVRMQIDNPKGLLKPAMFANAQIEVGKGGKVLTVPASAVIDSGTRQVVLVRLAEGRFEPRSVTLGDRSEDYVEVLGGIAQGEQVVTSANFLIDAESNLKAALGGLGHAHGGATQDQPPATEQAQPAAVGHRAQGTLEAINADGSISIAHEAIKSLGWPGMTMDFPLANPSLAQGIKPGTAIRFELVERKPGEYVVTKLQAQPGTSHGGH
ncbi:MAG: efflux RND transporter periplasmic adaptor subunit [Gallionellaceae bacterium]|nr:MAG: efflux RND transporter periplasmic adaptor subunit [Gallionellaceae bacterium]